MSIVITLEDKFATGDGNMNKSFKTNDLLKTKKCQPAAGDTPDLIQTECVTDSGLAHQIWREKKSGKQD